MRDKNRLAVRRSSTIAYGRGTLQLLHMGAVITAYLAPLFIRCRDINTPSPNGPERADDCSVLATKKQSFCYLHHVN